VVRLAKEVGINAEDDLLLSFPVYYFAYSWLITAKYWLSRRSARRELQTQTVINSALGVLFMASTQVRISSATHQILRRLSAEVGESMQTIIEEAVEQYRRRRFLEGLNQDFKALKEDAQAWQEELAERALLG
jgi:FtsZ-binding cell division protein ZapB